MTSDYISMLVYSPAGHGKTTLLGSGFNDPRIAPMLLLDFEAGTESIQSKIRVVDTDSIGHPIKNKIDVVRVRQWDDLDKVYLELVNGKVSAYQSIALDSLTEMNYLNLLTIVEAAMAVNPRHLQDTAEMADYLRSAFMMRKLIRGFRDLPTYCFFTAGVQEVTDPISKTPQVVPALNGKLALEAPGLVTIVGYLGLDGSTRILLTQPTNRFIAKDRTEGGKLGAYVENPTLTKMFDLIQPKNDAKPIKAVKATKPKPVVAESTEGDLFSQSAKEKEGGK